MLYHTLLQMALRHCSVCNSLQHTRYRIGRDCCTHDTQFESSTGCQWKRNVDMYSYFCYVVYLTRPSIFLDYTVEWWYDKWIGNDMRRNKQGLIRDSISAFSYKDWGKPWKYLLKIVGGPAEIQIRYLPCRSSKHYCMSQFTQWYVFILRFSHVRDLFRL
jgi:hypothetical protein